MSAIKEIPVDQLTIMAGHPGLVDTLKWIIVFWIAVLLANRFVRKYVPELMSWYPFYSALIGLILTVLLLVLAS